MSTNGRLTKPALPPSIISTKANTCWRSTAATTVLPPSRTATASYGRPRHRQAGAFSEESFFTRLKSAVNDLKLRVSYGQLPNQMFNPLSPSNSSIYPYRPHARHCVRLLFGSQQAIAVDATGFGESRFHLGNSGYERCGRRLRIPWQPPFRQLRLVHPHHARHAGGRPDCPLCWAPRRR